MDEYREIEVTFSTEEIEEYLFKRLLKLGYVPVQEELEDIADIMFDFILDKTGAEEVDEEG
jgi:hypothetical protein